MERDLGKQDAFILFHREQVGEEASMGISERERIPVDPVMKETPYTFTYFIVSIY